MVATEFEAHLDGEHIVLDEPAELAPDTRLRVTVVPAEVKTSAPTQAPPTLDWTEVAEAEGLRVDW